MSSLSSPGYGKAILYPDTLIWNSKHAGKTQLLSICCVSNS
jgi:hypothetical protein